MPDSDLTPAQSKRLATLAELSDDDIETLIRILRKEAAWTFLRSYTKGAALFFVSIITALTLFFDSIKASVRSLFH